MGEPGSSANEGETQSVQEENLLASPNGPDTLATPTTWQRIIGMFNFIWTYWKPPINYIIDVVTDISATVQYWLSPDILCGILGVTFTVVPLIIGTIYKFKMDGIREMSMLKKEANKTHVNENNPDDLVNNRTEDSQKSESQGKTGLCTRIRRSFLIAWYLEILFAAIRHGNLRDENLYISNCALLIVIESFLESAPQINLQWFYELRRNGEEAFSAFAIAFTCIKIVLLVSSIPSYCKAIRDIQKNDYNNLSIFSTITLILWNLLLITPRVFLISLFAARYPLEAIISIFTHAGVMIIFLLIITRNVRQELCHTRCLMSFHCIVLGFVYTYTYVHITGENHKRNYIVFYIISIIENFVIAYFIGVFYMFLPGACVIGLFIMILYFCRYHPSREVRSD